MKVFVFDLLPYAEHLEHLKQGKELPYPLPRRHFKPEVAVRTYEEHLRAWQELDRLGYDGVGFNEHHTSPYGLMNSPNLMAASAAQRTRRIKLLIYGNLLPLHDPLRLAEELAMLDCLSSGRIVSGFARGIPREHNVYRVPLRDSRARFEEAWEIVRRAWTEEVFSYTGRFWSYDNVAIWPRPVQQPHPPVWVPVTGSKETIEWAGAPQHSDHARPGADARPARGHHPLLRALPGAARPPADARSPDHPGQRLRGRQQGAGGEGGRDPTRSTSTRRCSATATSARPRCSATPAISARARSTTCGPRTWPRCRAPASDFRDMTLADVERDAEQMPWGTPEEVIERITAAADHAGANTVLINVNRGAMPQEMFMNQIQRIGSKVLPALQAHQVTRTLV